MKRETLQELRSGFPGGSWALWSDAFPAEGCPEEDHDRLTDFIHSNNHRLTDRVVLLSLNPSAVEPPGYQNFHSTASKHYDHRLKEFIQENGLENLIGAYMADIVPDVVNSDSNNVSPDEADTERFLNLLEVLGNDEYDVICFSRQAFEALQDDFGAEIESLPQNITSFNGTANQISVTAYRVWHYSNYGANADKVPELEQQLCYLNDEILDE